jgi:hypothetical protein
MLFLNNNLKNVLLDVFIITNDFDDVKKQTKIKNL